jgi:hypothetical protein
LYPNGSFSLAFPTSSLPVGTYTVTYTYMGDSDFRAASPGTSTLKVVPLAVPKITLNPTNQTLSAGDPAYFTAAATGSPVLTVQWQISTDGGLTWTNITGNSSAQTTTLIWGTLLGETGYKFRAVFTNSAGTATTKAATLTVEGD